MYHNLYDIIAEYIYGMDLTQDAELTCTIMATIGCVFLVSLPFMIVWKIIKAITNI